jgi:hypothetical protein
MEEADVCENGQHMPQNNFISILNFLKTKEKRLCTASACAFCLDRKYYITSGMNDELKGR